LSSIFQVILFLSICPYRNPSLFKALSCINENKSLEVLPSLGDNKHIEIDDTLDYDSCDEDVVDEEMLLDREDYANFKQEIAGVICRTQDKKIKKTA